jgi:sorbitol/mannitol transport system substrate-binding protein
MWYDATSAAGSLEQKGTPSAGKIGYVAAPVVKTASSGWLYTWAWAIEKASKKKDAAWKFISWASSKDYEKLVGEKLGWTNVPAGKRNSTYSIPQYLQASAAFAKPTQAAILAADPANPGVQPRPTVGIQFVDIPEFSDLGTKVSQYISTAIAGQMSVKTALDKGQNLANKVAKSYRSQ